jgi:hypothetical protein
LTIISVDRSGEIGKTDIWFVAVKEVGGQRHPAVFIHLTTQSQYSTRFPVRWKERLAAASIFYVVDKVFRSGDTIQIDKDYQGKTADYIAGCLQRLFGLKYPNDRLAAKPEVQFIPDMYSQNVKRAHSKSKKARYGVIPSDRNPNLNSLLGMLM